VIVERGRQLAVIKKRSGEVLMFTYPGKDRKMKSISEGGGTKIKNQGPVRKSRSPCRHRRSFWGDNPVMRRSEARWAWETNLTG